MGTILVEEVQVSTIQVQDSATLTVGLAVFPTADASSRATASFGEVASFAAKSTYQRVTSAAATINPETTIVGVEFEGPVVLTLSDTVTTFNQVSIIDEAGFCSALNTITVTSAGALGSLVLSSPYSHIDARNNGSIWISEAKDTVPVITIPPVLTEPGATTEVSEDGTSTVTSADGNTTFTVNPDGSTQLAVVDGAVTRTTIIQADGTEIQAEADWSGNSSSNTILPDGTSIDQVNENNGNSSTFTQYPDGSSVQQIDSNTGASSTFSVSADGTTTDIQNSSSGNFISVVTGPNGQITTEVIQNNGSSESSVVSPDGSSHVIATSSSGIVTVTHVDSSGTEVQEVYKPWQSTYTQTTTPPGSSEVLSPNPYEI